MMIRRLITAAFPLRLFGAALLSLSLLAAVHAAPAQEKTSENDSRLANWLEKYPEADADKDGVLADSEAKAFARKAVSERWKELTARLGRGAAPALRGERYGPHERNVLDFYKADADGPTPVLIYFHGGGFVAGDKRKGGSVPLCRQCLTSGISVVSANYRFVSLGRAGQPAVSFPAPMLDGARVVQYVRSKAESWNIDPEHVALCGGSAGACMSIWLATHDDLADPESEDPIARQSTRISAVVAYGGQTVLDPKVIVEHIGGNPSIHPSLLPFFGVTSIDDLRSPEKQQLIGEASATTHVTDDDAPLYLRYGGRLAGTPLPPRTPIGISIHHAMFGKLIKDKYDERGLTCHLVYSGHPGELDELGFLKKCFATN